MIIKNKDLPCRTQLITYCHSLWFKWCYLVQACICWRWADQENETQSSCPPLPVEAGGTAQVFLQAAAHLGLHCWCCTWIHSQNVSPLGASSLNLEFKKKGYSYPQANTPHNVHRHKHTHYPEKHPQQLESNRIFVRISIMLKLQKPVP